jgi:hypothetical protein
MKTKILAALLVVACSLPVGASIPDGNGIYWACYWWTGVCALSTRGSQATTMILVPGTVG